MKKLSTAFWKNSHTSGEVFLGGIICAPATYFSRAAATAITLGDQQQTFRTKSSRLPRIMPMISIGTEKCR